MTDRLGSKFSVGFSPWSASLDGLNRFCAVDSAIASAGATANNRDAANADVGHQSRLPDRSKGSDFRMRLSETEPFQ